MENHILFENLFFLCVMRCAWADARKAFQLHNFCLQCETKMQFFTFYFGKINKRRAQQIAFFKKDRSMFVCLQQEGTSETEGSGNETDNVVSLDEILHENFTLKWVFFCHVLFHYLEWKSFHFEGKRLRKRKNCVLIFSRKKYNQFSNRSRENREPIHVNLYTCERASII